MVGSDPGGLLCPYVVSGYRKSTSPSQEDRVAVPTVTNGGHPIGRDRAAWGGSHPRQCNLLHANQTVRLAQGRGELRRFRGRAQ